MEPPRGKSALQIEAIRKSIESSAGNRRTVISLQNALEAAWRDAMSQCKAINRRMGSEQIEDLEAKRQIQEAEHKKRRIEALQQSTFLSFQTLTEHKHERQLENSAQILAELEQGKLSKAARLGQQFLDEEDRINKEFLARISATRKKFDKLVLAAKSALEMPCDTPRIDRVLRHDANLLLGFLKSTRNLLGDPPKIKLRKTRDKHQKGSCPTKK